MRVAVWINETREERKRKLEGGKIVEEVRQYLYPYTWQSALPFYRLELPHNALEDSGLAEVIRINDPHYPDGVICDLLACRGLWSDGHLNFVKRLHEKGIKIVCDVDDNVFEATHHVGGWFTPERKEKIARVISAVDGLTCTQERLAESLKCHMAQDGTSSKGPEVVIGVFPNRVDPDLLRPRIGLNNKIIRIGWAGGNSHLDDLLLIAPVLNKLAKRYGSSNGVEAMIFGMGGVDMNKYMACFQVAPVPFAQYFEVLQGLEFDIAIAPMVDTEFNRGKSDLRIREMACLGIPIVASAVGPYQEAVTEGFDGFLAASADEWEEKLTRLILDAQLRREMGRAARRKAETIYSCKLPEVAIERHRFYEDLLNRLN